MCGKTLHEKPLNKLKVSIQHVSDLEVSSFTQNQEQGICTSRDSDADSSKLEGKDKPVASTSTSDPGEKPSSPSSKSPSELPDPSMSDMLDYSQPLKDSQTTTDNKQTQALDLSIDKITLETRMTLHPRSNRDNKESSESTAATSTSSLDIPKSHDSGKKEFKIKVIGVKKYKPKYSFKCNICDQIMHSIKEWNMHPCKEHSDVILDCEDCGKSFAIPSSLCDHSYNHRGQAFKCETCHLSSHSIVAYSYIIIYMPVHKCISVLLAIVE